MKFVMFFHHQQFPKPPKMHRWVCGCGYTIFKASSENIVVSNDIGLPWAEYSPSQTLIELECHRCKTKYTIAFQ